MVDALRQMSVLPDRDFPERWRHLSIPYGFTSIHLLSLFPRLSCGFRIYDSALLPFAEIGQNFPFESELKNLQRFENRKFEPRKNQKSTVKRVQIEA